MKNIDWKNIGWRSLQGLIAIILNTPLWVFLIGSITGGGNYYKDGVVSEENLLVVKWFAELELKEQAILVGFTFLGIMISIAFIAFLYKEHRQDKRVRTQTKEMKDEQRTNKDINKYL